MSGIRSMVGRDLSPALLQPAKICLKSPKTVWDRVLQYEEIKPKPLENFYTSKSGI